MPRKEKRTLIRDYRNKRKKNPLTAKLYGSFEELDEASKHIPFEVQDKEAVTEFEQLFSTKFKYLNDVDKFQEALNDMFYTEYPFLNVDKIETIFANYKSDPSSPDAKYAKWNAKIDELNKKRSNPQIQANVTKTKKTDIEKEIKRVYKESLKKAEATKLAKILGLEKQDIDFH